MFGCNRSVVHVFNNQLFNRAKAGRSLEGTELTAHF